MKLKQVINAGLGIATEVGYALVIILAASVLCLIIYIKR